MNKRIVTSLLFSLPLTSYAGSSSIYGEITGILNYEGHSGTLLYMAEPMAASAGFCPRNDYYILPLNHPLYSQNYSLILATKLAGKKITLIVSSGNCVDNMPKIEHVRLD